MKRFFVQDIFISLKKQKTGICPEFLRTSKVINSFQMAKYITKAERDIQKADERIRQLLKTFGDHILSKNGIDKPVDNNDIEDFILSLKK